LRSKRKGLEQRGGQGLIYVSRSGHEPEGVEKRVERKKRDISVGKTTVHKASGGVGRGKAGLLGGKGGVQRREECKPSRVGIFQIL